MTYSFITLWLLSVLAGCSSASFSGRNPYAGKNADASDVLVGPGTEPTVESDGGDGGEAGGEVDAADGASGEVFIVETVDTPVDIIISIDRSPSMDDESAFLENNITKFLENLQASKIDAKVFVIADPLRPPRRRKRCRW